MVIQIIKLLGIYQILFNLNVIKKTIDVEIITHKLLTYNSLGNRP